MADSHTHMYLCLYSFFFYIFLSRSVSHLWVLLCLDCFIDEFTQSKEKKQNHKTNVNNSGNDLQNAENVNLKKRQQIAEVNKA